MQAKRESPWLTPEVRVAPFPDAFRHATGEWVRALRSSYRRLRPGVAVGLQIVLCALAWRAISALAAFLSNVVFPLDQTQQFTVTGRAHLFWDALARYDSGWYLGIARNGYAFVEGGRSNLAFFPTYPVSMGYLGYLLGGGQANYYFAGLIISWAAFAGAMVMLYRLARLDLGREAAARACVYAAVFPFAFFYGAVYPSSLFLFLTLGAVYAFRRGHWAIGAFAGALVTCTRVNGILLWPALALLVWAHWRHDRQQFRRACIALAIVPAGLLAYSAYTLALSGSPIEWAESIKRWNYHPGQSPLRVFALLLGSVGDFYAFVTTRPSGPYDLLNGLAALGGVIAVPFVWRRFGAAYGVYMAANLALPLSSGEFEGLGRYTAVLFPLFLWLATHRRTITQAGILATFAMFYMLCQALFVTLRPIF